MTPWSKKVIMDRPGIDGIDLIFAPFIPAGFCTDAVRFEERNRYSNQFPMDFNLVRVPGLDYINASYIELECLRHCRGKFIITMGPLHPDSFSKSHQSDYGRVSKIVFCSNIYFSIYLDFFFAE